MPYLIDGHNLIPRVVGLSLRQADDEERLLELLAAFCARRRARVVVYFDRAAPGFAGRRSYGAVGAVFVREGRTADEAIAAHLQRVGRTARNWTVVSSDHEVQRAARWAGAKVMPSEEFARLLCVPTGDSYDAEKPESPPPEEVDELLRLFGGDGEEVD